MIEGSRQFWRYMLDVAPDRHFDKLIVHNYQLKQARAPGTLQQQRKE